MKCLFSNSTEKFKSPLELLQIVLLVAMVILLPDVLVAQEAEDSDLYVAKIVGDLSDGSSVPPVEAVEPPDFRVRSSQVQQKADHKLIFQMVEKPVLLEKKKPAASEPTEEELQAMRERVEEALPQEAAPKFVVLSATIYDQQISYVQWLFEKKNFEAWSNLNFNHLSGFTQFQGRGQKYTVMMALTNSTAKYLEQSATEYPEELRFQAPEGLTSLEEWGPGYMLVAGDESNDEAMKLMDALHDLYDNEGSRLKAACEERERNRIQREEELRRNPPVKEDVTIHMWKKN